MAPYQFSKNTLKKKSEGHQDNIPQLMMLFNIIITDILGNGFTLWTEIIDTIKIAL